MARNISQLENVYYNNPKKILKTFDEKFRTDE
jgi:hypothetical protein